jgi:hypothetical protein
VGLFRATLSRVLEAHGIEPSQLQCIELRPARDGHILADLFLRLRGMQPTLDRAIAENQVAFVFDGASYLGVEASQEDGSSSTASHALTASVTGTLAGLEPSRKGGERGMQSETVADRARTALLAWRGRGQAAA